MRHAEFIEESFLTDGYTAGCLCGWKGPHRDTRMAAQNDLLGHRSASLIPVEPVPGEGERGAEG